MNARIIIRSDASSTIGFGHVMRCLALAQAWQDIGGKSVFVSAVMPSTLSERLAEEDLTSVPISLGQPVGSDWDAKQLIEIAQKQQANWIVVDGYVFGSSYLKKIKDAGFKLLWVDDSGSNASLEADLIVNQNIYAKPQMYPNRNSQTVLLLGVEYILLRREFQKWKDWERQFPPNADRVLITLGGSDTYQTLEQLIRAIEQMGMRSLNVVIVVGSHMTNIDKLEANLRHSSFNGRLKYDVANMPELMAWADLAISAAGSTSWEMAFMGLPRLAIVLAENQLSNALYLEEQGIAVYLGRSQHIAIDSIRDTIKHVLMNSQQRIKMSHKACRLVRGDGTARIVNRML